MNAPAAVPSFPRTPDDLFALWEDRDRAHELTERAVALRAYGDKEDSDRLAFEAIALMRSVRRRQGRPA
jgi:hypothetical protein